VLVVWLIMWEHFHHQADIGVRGIGDTVEQAFAEAAIALTAVVCSQDKIDPVEEVQIKCFAPDNELLLVDWLNAVIYKMSVRQMVFAKYQVKIDGENLTARAWGEKCDPAKHETAVEAKAATYMCLSVHQDDTGNWVAQCVVDV